MYDAPALAAIPRGTFPVSVDLELYQQTIAPVVRLATSVAIILQTYDRAAEVQPIYSRVASLLTIARRIFMGKSLSIESRNQARVEARQLNRILDDHVVQLSIRTSGGQHGN